jgi:hypothetical protein
MPAYPFAPEALTSLRRCAGILPSSEAILARGLAEFPPFWEALEGGGAAENLDVLNSPPCSLSPWSLTRDLRRGFDTEFGRRKAVPWLPGRHNITQSENLYLSRHSRMPPE